MDMPCEDMNISMQGQTGSTESVIDLTVSVMNVVGQLQCNANILNANIQTLVPCFV